MTVEAAFEFFKAVPMIARKLQTLLDVGLGYIRLGQSATTLSGGEAQRVKLSQELSKRDTGRTLYILDEPTTGLHFHDIALLLKVIHAPARPRQHGGRDRAQPRRHQDCGLDHRPRPGRRRRRRPRSSPKVRSKRSARRRQATPASTWSAARATRRRAEPAPGELAARQAPNGRARSRPARRRRQARPGARRRMSLASVRAFFAEKAPDIEVIELPVDNRHGCAGGAGTRRRARDESRRRCRCGSASTTCWSWRAVTRASTTASSRPGSAARPRCSMPGRSSS